MKVMRYSDSGEGAKSFGFEIHLSVRDRFWIKRHGYKSSLHLVVHFWDRLDEVYILFRKIDKTTKV